MFSPSGRMMLPHYNIPRYTAIHKIYITRFIYQKYRRQIVSAHDQFRCVILQAERLGDSFVRDLSVGDVESFQQCRGFLERLPVSPVRQLQHIGQGHVGQRQCGGDGGTLPGMLATP